MARWQEIDHTADLSIHVWGDDLADLFAGAALGMFSLVAEAAETEVWVVEAIEMTAIDAEALLVDWLNELLYLHEVKQAVFLAFEIKSISPVHLDAMARGRPVRRYLAHIKAATYHNLEIVETTEGYETELVFDI
ncbi:MAG: archease [Anaerolineae bacterium]